MIFNKKESNLKKNLSFIGHTWHVPADLEALDEEDEAPGMEALFASASGHGSFSPAFMDDALFADFGKFIQVV